MERACAPSLAAALGPLWWDEPTIRRGRGQPEVPSAAPLPASGVVPHASQWDTCVERWRPALGKSALAYSRPSSPGACTQAGRPLPLRPRSVVAPASRRPARRHHNWRQGRPAGAAAIRPGAQGAVPSAEARPVSAPSPIAGSAYRPTSSKRSRAGSWLYLRPSKRGREASNATCWRLWSRPASATGGGAHDWLRAEQRWLTH